MYEPRNKNQFSLLSKQELRYVKSWSHGGFSKRRKIKRPLIANKTTHLVFKSVKAKGTLSFLSHDIFLKKLIANLARRHFVTVQQLVNMGNHIHLKVKFKNVENFQNFMRTFAALSARHITRARRGRAFGKFWDGLAFTRVLHSRLEELQLNGYLFANVTERDCGGKGPREFVLDELNLFLKRLKSVRAVPQEKSLVVLRLE